jgi:hypothetical protein
MDVVGELDPTNPANHPKPFARSRLVALVRRGGAELEARSRSGYRSQTGLPPGWRQADEVPARGFAGGVDDQ